jgi:hypothetical protein
MAQKEVVRAEKPDPEVKPPGKHVRPGDGGEGGTGTTAHEEGQIATALT